MQSVAAQRWTGLGMLLGGAGFTFWQWSGNGATGSVALQGAFAFPFFAVLGVALLAGGANLLRQLMLD